MNVNFYNENQQIIRTEIVETSNEKETYNIVIHDNGLVSQEDKFPLFLARLKATLTLPDIKASIQTKYNQRIMVNKIKFGLMTMHLDLIQGQERKTIKLDYAYPITKDQYLIYKETLNKLTQKK